jgi:hypothetical protein
MLYVDSFLLLFTIWFVVHYRHVFSELASIYFHCINSEEDELDEDDAVIDPTEKYIEKNKKVFLEKFPGDNSGIDPLFYKREEFLEVVKQENNYLELEWKRKLLFESTPRGNLLMFYDPFKQAFVYYSDSAVIPYNVLNACAMKYVRMFSCYDFFMDTSVLPEDTKSPFTKMMEEEEKKEKERIEQKKKDLGINLKDAPFAKLKSYRPVGFIDNKSSSGSDQNVPPNIKSAPSSGILKKSVENRKVDAVVNTGHKNIFRYLGKIANTSFLQAVEKPKPQNMKLDYASFKRMMAEKKENNQMKNEDAVPEEKDDSDGEDSEDETKSRETSDSYDNIINPFLPTPPN